jgi:4-amino-4-deoxy-L-arabinose transferase-like glycosyltransferase
MGPIFLRPTPLRIVGVLLLTIGLGWVGANSIDYVTWFRPGPDAGEYASGAMMLAEGRVLYRDVMEVKPPVIYALNAFSFFVGGESFHSIRLLERGFAIAAVVLVFALVLTIFERVVVAALAAIGYSFLAYSTDVLEGGNVTEEYASVFILAGALCAVHAVRRSNPPSAWLSALAGALFACAALTKEPFVVSSFPWLAWLVLAPRAEHGSARGRGAVFIAGALVPALACLAYLVSNDAFLSWIDKTSASFNYVSAKEDSSFSESLGTMLVQFDARVILCRLRQDW